MAIGGRIALLAATLTAVSTVCVRAQDRVVTIFAYGGGYSALRDLEAAGSAELRTGFTIGGGVGYRMDKTVELRATLTGAQSQVVEEGTPTGVYLNRYYVGADLKAQYPAQTGITPYGFLGAGAVLLHEKGTNGADKTQGFATLGLGVAYSLGTSGLSVFAQGASLFYSLSQMTSPGLGRFSKVQIDLGWSAGASYRFPL